MDDPLNRAELLRLLKISSATFDQRVLKGELCFAFGLTRPAHIGEYSVLDAVAVLLVSMLNGLARVEYWRGAEMIRIHWREWLIGLAQAERQMEAEPGSQTYFAVGTDYDGNQVAAFGTPGEASATLAERGGPFVTQYGMPLQVVIRILRENARQAAIILPDFLTPEPGTAEFEKFEEQIRDHQRRAQARLKKKALA